MELVDPAVSRSNMLSVPVKLYSPHILRKLEGIMAIIDGPLTKVSIPCAFWRYVASSLLPPGQILTKPEIFRHVQQLCFQSSYPNPYIGLHSRQLCSKGFENFSDLSFDWRQESFSPK